MEFILWNVFFALLSAVSGVFIGWVISDPDRIPRWIALNKLGGNWEGDWWCIWQYPDDKTKLIIDEVQLIQRFGKLKIKILKTGSKFNWEGIGTIKTPYFMGEWKSIHPHSHSRGSFTFSVAPQGDRMIGFFIGPDSHGQTVSLDAILISDKNIVESIRLSFTQQSNKKTLKSLHQIARKN